MVKKDFLNKINVLNTFLIKLKVVLNESKISWYLHFENCSNHFSDLTKNFQTKFT